MSAQLIAVARVNICNMQSKCEPEEYLYRLVI
jgi:hypothetical protein